MPAYHSAIPADGKKFIGNVPVLPLRITAKGTGRGPAPPTITPDEEDIVDESLNLFKANILFTAFEVTAEGQILSQIPLKCIICRLGMGDFDFVLQKCEMKCCR